MAIAPTVDTLDEAVRKWVSDGSGIDFDSNVIPGNDNGPSPSGLYATVLEIDDTPEGFAYYDLGRGVNEGDEIAKQSSTIRYSLQWFRAGARNAGKRFRLWAQSSAGIAEAERHGFTLYGVSDIRRLDAIDDYKQWEERVQLDVSLGVVISETRTVPIITGVEAVVCLNGEDEARLSLTEEEPIT